MADEVRDDPSALAFLDRLAEDPREFELYAALRAIQAAHPTHPRIGRSEWIHEDPVRLKHEPTLAFGPSELTEYAPGSDEAPPRLHTIAFGLFGPNGPLPHHLTERAVEAIQRRQRQLPDFVDIFHHRLISLLYRAWETGQITASRDRLGGDSYARWLNSLFGAGPEAFRDRDALPDDTRRFLAGRFAERTRNASGISALLQTLTGARVAVVEFVGEWLPVPADERSAIGRRAVGLGVDALVGTRQYSLQSRLRARIGPLTLAQYRALLPSGALFPRLRDAMRSYLGLALGWELQLVLAADEKPPLTLNGTCTLGWDSWLGEDVQFANADDLKLSDAGG